MNAPASHAEALLDAPLAEVVAPARQPGLDIVGLHTRVEALAARHPLHPQLSGDPR